MFHDDKLQPFGVRVEAYFRNNTESIFGVVVVNFPPQFLPQATLSAFLLHDTPKRNGSLLSE